MSSGCWSRREPELQDPHRVLHLAEPAHDTTESDLGNKGSSIRSVRLPGNMLGQAVNSWGGLLSTLRLLSRKAIVPVAVQLL